MPTATRPPRNDFEARYDAAQDRLEKAQKAVRDAESEYIAAQQEFNAAQAALGRSWTRSAGL